MATNIRDVAKAAGVSVATVSKVLNGYTTVNQQTKERVLKVVKEKQFRPNAAARSLVGRRSMMIGVFLTTGLAHPFFTPILAGMEQSLKAKGYDLIYLAQFTWEKEYSFVRHCQSRNVEGVVVFGFQHSDMNFTELSEAGIPTLFIDLDVDAPRTGAISSNNTEAVQHAVQYLKEINHEQIAFLSGYEDTYVSRCRLAGYEAGMRLAGLAIPIDYVVASDFTKQGGYTAMRELLAHPSRPTAVICSSDMGAIGAITAIREAGLAVPEDISVIGFDDIELASHVHPPLTTIRQNTDEMGRKAVELLDQLINNIETASVQAIIPTELVIRASSAQRG
ncbi:MAG: LacI family DNA-binding transcriptional regulator [Candidatus Cohnella colombiensis]|uniref:LacI family DNA-binding transcriptional regulator n=1 Tax=Candidatus Cohnella colombiensis TaxID=3121368 RepID=A0AA95JFJ8_9BACL|nr:MAG: LacI family DNA-binding transcriptional regulator [Cohnella sp.]